jgi:hypothetical protein
MSITCAGIPVSEVDEELTNAKRETNSLRFSFNYIIPLPMSPFFPRHGKKNN